MSELIELMQHANNVAETAKEAMARSLAADKTTDAVTRKILDEAKRVLPRNAILEAIILRADGDLSWTSVRSAMEAVATALSEENSTRRRNAPSPRGRTKWG